MSQKPKLHPLTIKDTSMASSDGSLGESMSAERDIERVSVKDAPSMLSLVFLCCEPPPLIGGNKVDVSVQQVIKLMFVSSRY